MNSFKEKIFSVTEKNFDEAALSLFHYQAQNNPVYRLYLKNLGINHDPINQVPSIPFLPIRLFKSQIIKTGLWTEEIIFESSGTSSEKISYHYIEDIGYYHRTAGSIFNRFYGDLSGYVIIALLPSYLERKNSSLINMMDNFIRLTGSPDSGFYLNKNGELLNIIRRVSLNKKKRLILWGVTYALIDLAQCCEVNLKDSIVIETGGMKGRREDMVREEVHKILYDHFQSESIHSEYGMAELLSQAYSTRSGEFKTPPWMKILLRDINDPFDMASDLKFGAVNIIDLANVHSCAFIETEDLGQLNRDGTFEILGRVDNSDIRGCNMLLN